MGFPLTPKLMTLNCCKAKFSWNFATFLVFRRPLTANRMKIDEYCEQGNYSPLNALFGDV